ncbi:hypothetical protein [Ramlibacter sp. AN1133]|uniref:hypothetical protein n=1 Tax=Ramlibacter sp. AN1133 TaxID=3133429 RepID=UPI0030C2BEF2
MNPSFTFEPPDGGGPFWPRFEAVWFFTVPPSNRATFELRIAALESAALQTGPGVLYQGTYTVTASGLAPAFEYRMVWGLESLAAVQELNNMLHAAPPMLRGCLELISQMPVMRAEIMGRTAGGMMLTVG